MERMSVSIGRRAALMVLWATPVLAALAPVTRGAIPPPAPVATAFLPATATLLAATHLPVRLPALNPAPAASRTGFLPLELVAGPSGYRLAWLAGATQLAPWRHPLQVKSLPSGARIIIAGALAQPGPAERYLGLALGTRLRPLPGQPVALGPLITGYARAGRHRRWVLYRDGADLYAVGVRAAPGAPREAVRLARSMVRVRQAVGHRYHLARLIARPSRLTELIDQVTLTPATHGPHRWAGFRYRAQRTVRTLPSLKERMRVAGPASVRIGTDLHVSGRLIPVPPPGLVVRARLEPRALATGRLVSLGGDPTPGWAYAAALPVAQAMVTARGDFTLTLPIPLGYEARTRGAVTSWRALRPAGARVALSVAGPGGNLLTRVLRLKLLAPASPPSASWTLIPPTPWGPAVPVALPATLPWELVPARGLRVPLAPRVFVRADRRGVLLMVVPARTRLAPFTDRLTLAGEATAIVADGHVGLGLHPLSIPVREVLGGWTVTLSRSSSAVLVVPDLGDGLACQILVRSSHPLAMARRLLAALHLYVLGAPVRVADLVQGYWQLVARGHLRAAYAAWMPGGAFRRAVGYPRFAHGFAQTAALRVQVGTPRGLSVPVVVVSRLKNGTLQRFTGTMTAGWQGSENRLRLVAASIAPCSGTCHLPHA